MKFLLTSSAVGGKKSQTGAVLSGATASVIDTERGDRDWRDRDRDRDHDRR
jgi:hypothetical protein